MSSEKLLNVLCAEAVSSELEPLGLFLDQVDSNVLKSGTPAGAETFRTAAQRARKLIESGVDLPSVRRKCQKSPALMELLEAVLFDRAASRGVLALSVDFSRYGK